MSTKEIGCASTNNKKWNTNNWCRSSSVINIWFNTVLVLSEAVVGKCGELLVRMDLCTVSLDIVGAGLLIKSQVLEVIIVYIILILNIIEVLLKVICKRVVRVGAGSLKEDEPMLVSLWDVGNKVEVVAETVVIEAVVPVVVALA